MASTANLCIALTALLGKQKVDSPGTTAYTSELSSYFSVQQETVHPTCFVTPQTVQDVSVTVDVLVKAKTKFAIRSGGHTSWAGASNIAGGVTIDLRPLNSIVLSADKSTVSVGVGASWDQVYAKLDPLGLSVAGGRAAGVGVGGLTLGGGISLFSPRYGWTLDQVVNFQVVLADGSIVNANSNANSDLFFALKGGNNNFGIVTNIQFTTFKQGLIWSATVYNPTAVVDQVIAEFVKLNSATSYDPYASFISTFVYNQARGISVIANNLQYTKETGGPALYKGFTDIPNFVNTSEVTSVTTSSQQTAALNPSGKRSISLVSTLVSTQPVIKAAFNLWNSSVPAIANVPNITYSYSLEPLPPIFYSRHATTNALGFAGKTKPLIIALVTATWVNAADDALVTITSNNLLKAINAKAAQLGGLDNYIYLDYAGQFQDPICSYGPASVSALKKTQKRVDPTGVFTNLVPGGYKL